MSIKLIAHYSLINTILILLPSTSQLTQEALRPRWLPWFYRKMSHRDDLWYLLAFAVSAGLMELALGKLKWVK